MSKSTDRCAKFTLIKDFEFARKPIVVRAVKSEREAQKNCKSLNALSYSYNPTTGRAKFYDSVKGLQYVQGVFSGIAPTKKDGKTDGKKYGKRVASKPQPVYSGYQKFEELEAKRQKLKAKLTGKNILKEIKKDGKIILNEIKKDGKIVLNEIKKDGKIVLTEIENVCCRRKTPQPCCRRKTPQPCCCKKTTQSGCQKFWSFQWCKCPKDKKNQKY